MSYICRVYLDAHVLKTGVILADLPGMYRHLSHCSSQNGKLIRLLIQACKIQT